MRMIMRRLWRLGILAGAMTMASAAAQDGVIHNDTLWRDSAGAEIWCNGGGMIREGDVFYWVGYETARGRPWRINLYTSGNLSDWKFEKTLIRQEGKFAAIGWAGRPGLLHNRRTGKYVIVFEDSSPGVIGQHRVGFAASDRVDGTYDLVGTVYPEGTRSTGDQSVFQEGDQAFLVCTLDTDIGGKRYLDQALAIFQLTDDFQGVAKKLFEGFDNVNGDTKVVPRSQSAREASHIIRVGGTYYWFTSGLEGWKSTATWYTTAKALAGPWAEMKPLATEPASPDSFNTQHDFVIPVVGRETTTYVYVGDRYSQHTGRGVGRNIFLPLVWKDGVPTLRWLKDWRIDVATGRVAEEAVDREP